MNARQTKRRDHRKGLAKGFTILALLAQIGNSRSHARVSSLATSQDVRTTQQDDREHSDRPKNMAFHSYLLKSCSPHPNSSGLPSIRRAKLANASQEWVKSRTRDTMVENKSGNLGSCPSEKKTGHGIFLTLGYQSRTSAKHRFLRPDQDSFVGGFFFGLRSFNQLRGKRNSHGSGSIHGVGETTHLAVTPGIPHPPHPTSYGTLHPCG